ncbi:cobaltochelatase subunit CobN, partial [Pseudomonas graminis]|uniref:cobaltochelatase subunit CobN n=1 Tax=Pseudomonas graminis TaxID=158627 RepID=UPI003C1C65D5
IRDGLHVFGESPTGRLCIDTLLAMVRVPRGDGRGGQASQLRALSQALALDFDPLDCDLCAPWTGDKPQALHEVSAEPWRTTGDTRERLELL